MVMLMRSMATVAAFAAQNSTLAVTIIIALWMNRNMMLLMMVMLIELEKI